jgi:ABC-2 type transport system permease protein
MSTEAAVYEVRGPSALAGDWRRSGDLAVMLAFTDWKLRFFGSVLGYFWSLLRPLLLFAVLYAVFSQIVDVSGTVEDYPVQLLIGVILFSFWSEVTGGSVTSVVDRESLVRKIAFPRAVIPLAVALGAAFNLFLNLLVLGAFLAIAGVEPQWTWLLVPFPLVFLMLFALGVSLMLSSLYVSFRDVQPIWEVILQALFYATPVIYPIEVLADKNESLSHLALMNPIAAVIQETRYLVLDHDTPSAAAAVGDGVLLVVPLLLVLLTAAIGYVIFDRLAPRIAERL